VNKDVAIGAVRDQTGVVPFDVLFRRRRKWPGALVGPLNPFQRCCCIRLKQGLLIVQK